jgi:ketosteroid isomerase-like protein
MKTPLLLTLATLTACPIAAAEKPDKEKFKAELVQVELAFAAMAQEKGVLPAFEHFAAPDVAFIDTDPRRFRGLEAVRQRMGKTPATTKLTWSPLFTDVSDDGTLGYNYGRYQARSQGADGTETVREGFFLTIWKRQPDGSWRYVMDNGAADRPPTPPPPPKP